jgi:glucokinase
MAQGSVLLADLNGRDLILALARPGEPPRDHVTQPCASLEDLEAALLKVVGEVGFDNLIGAAICAAGPEIDGAITITGTSFTISLGWLRGCCGRLAFI